MQEVRDYYFKRAKEEHYLARSVYKLMEIDRKFRLLQGGMRTLDIGCAPGSWSQFILQRIGKGQLVGMDLEDKVSIQDKRFTYVKADLLDPSVRTVLGPPQFDLMVSDAAPKTTGNGFSDAQASLRLVRGVFTLAEELLKTGGSVVAKVFQGEDVKGFVDGIRGKYTKVSLFKPKSSRKESRELFIIAQGRRKIG